MENQLNTHTPIRFPERPKIAVVGSGAIGGVFGGLLTASGQEVHFLVRSDYQIIRDRGWRIELRDGTVITASPAGVHASTESIGTCDLVIVGLKTTHNHLLPELLQPLLKPSTVILTLQNGMGNVESISTFHPLTQIMGGLCFIAATRTGPGIVRLFTGGRGLITFGEAVGPTTACTHAVAGLFAKGGVSFTLDDHFESALWHKLVWNIPFNGLAIAAGGVSTAEIVNDAKLLSETHALMHEVQAAAAARGVEISDAFIQRQIDVTIPMGAYKPSSVIDFNAGREVEVEAIWGHPLRRGLEAGANLPRLGVLYSLISALTNHPNEEKGNLVKGMKVPN